VTCRGVWRILQWEFHPCGAGFVIKNVSSGSFLTVEDLVGLHHDKSTEVITGDFPMCWEMEVMDNASAEDDENVDEDVYTRYVSIVVMPGAARVLILIVIRSIRLPRTEMFLGFRGGFAGAQVSP
jgi:hypothetical protein